MSDLKMIIAKNIQNLRKDNNMTQADLANKLNYSPKTISKWERGESIPEIETLKALSDYFGITVDYLLDPDAQYKKETYLAPSIVKSNRITITALLVSFIWTLATIVYVYISANTRFNPWPIFVWAVPLSFLIVNVYNRKIFSRKLQALISSCELWCFLIATYLQFIQYSIFLVFLVGIPIQTMLILWSRIKTI